MITVVNNITPKLKKLIAAIKEPRKPLYQAIGTACQAFTKRTFLTNGANIGETWQPLSPTTANVKKQKTGARRGYDHILRDTGSAYGKVSFNTIANGVEWGFPASVNYMKYHQTGGGRLPQRKVLGTSPALERKIKAITIEYWKKHMRFVK